MQIRETVCNSNRRLAGRTVNSPGSSRYNVGLTMNLFSVLLVRASLLTFPFRIGGRGGGDLTSTRLITVQPATVRSPPPSVPGQAPRVGYPTRQSQRQTTGCVEQNWEELNRKVGCRHDKQMEALCVYRNCMLPFMLEHHPHRPFPYLGGIPRSSVHCSILSRDGVSGTVGAVQYQHLAEVW